MTAMTIYADEVAVGDILDNGGVVIDVACDYEHDVDYVDVTVNVDGAVEIIGFGFDYLLPILRAVD